MRLRTRVAKRFERVVLGSAMTAIAFVIERKLIRAIKEKGDDVPTKKRKKAKARKGELTPGPGGPSVQSA